MANPNRSYSLHVPAQWSTGPGKPLGPRAFNAEIVDPNGGFIRQLRTTDGLIDESDLFNPTSGAGNLAASPHIVKVTQLDDNTKPVSSSYWYYDTHNWRGPYDEVPEPEMASLPPQSFGLGL